jgi:hypothetical protein
MSTAPRRAPPLAYKSRAPGQQPPHLHTPSPPQRSLAKPCPLPVAILPSSIEQSAPERLSVQGRGRSSASPSYLASSIAKAAPHRPDPPLPFLAVPRYQEGSCRSTEADDVAEPRRPSGDPPRPVAAPGEADKPPPTPRHLRSPPQAPGEPSPSRPALPSRCPSSPQSRRRRRPWAVGS